MRKTANQISMKKIPTMMTMKMLLMVTARKVRTGMSSRETLPPRTRPSDLTMKTREIIRRRKLVVRLGSYVF